MRVTIKRVGDVVQILEGAHGLPEGEEIHLFTAEELQRREQGHRDAVALQMASFLSGDEEEDAEELFHL